MIRGGAFIKVLLGLSFSLGLVCLLSNWALKSSYFRIQQIRVEGNLLLDQDEILRVAQVAKGENIFRFDGSGIEAKLEANPLVKRVKLLKRPPHLIEIKVVEKAPLFLVNKGGGLLVQGDGFTILPHSRIDLPILSGADELGERYAKDLILWIRATHPPLLDMVSQIGWKGGITLWLQNGCRVALGAGNFGEKISHLRRLLALMKDAGDNPRFIDLRFRDQAVVSKKGRL